MDKKNVLITSIIVAILLLVPFNVIAQDPGLDKPFEYDSKLEQGSKAYYEIPKNIDITDFDISKDEITNLKKQAESVKEVSVIIEEYTGNKISIIDVPVIQGEIELMTLPMMNFDQVANGIGRNYGDLSCLELFVFATWLTTWAALLYSFGAYTQAAVIAALAAAAWATWLLKCGGSSRNSETSSNAQKIVETILNGGTVNVKEVSGYLNTIQLQTTIRCGCKPTLQQRYL